MRGLAKEASPPTQLDSILCQGHPVIPLTGSIAFVTLDGALGTVCKRWYLDMDLAVEERPAASSSPASPCSRLAAP